MSHFNQKQTSSYLSLLPDLLLTVTVVTISEDVFSFFLNKTDWKNACDTVPYIYVEKLSLISFLW